MFENQNFNTHSFSPHLAEKYGWKDAVFLQHIYYWVKHNKGKGSNCHDGNWCTYNTRKGFAEYFRYLTEDDIRGVIDRLKKKNMIITNYNKVSWDKTTWHALTEFSLQLFGDTIEEIHQSKGYSPKSAGDNTVSSGEKAKSKKDDSPDNTNSKTSIKQFLSSSPEEKKEILKKIWEEQKLKSSYEKYFIFREKSSWKGVSNLNADIAWWEDGFLEKNPHLKNSETDQAKTAEQNEKQKQDDERRAEIQNSKFAAEVLEKINTNIPEGFLSIRKDI